MLVTSERMRGELTTGLDGPADERIASRSLQEFTCLMYWAIVGVR